MPKDTTIPLEHLVNPSIARSLGRKVIPEPMTLVYKDTKGYLGHTEIQLKFLTTELLIRFTKLSEVDQGHFAVRVLDAAKKHLRPCGNRLAQPEGLSLHIEIPWTQKKRRKINVSFEGDPLRVDSITILYVLNLRLI